MKYTRLFQTDQQLEAAYNGSDYIEPWLALSKESETVTYNKTEEQKLVGIPLTFEIVSGGNIAWYTGDNNYTKTIEYKKNDGEWTEITSAYPEQIVTGISSDDFGSFVYSGQDDSNAYVWTGANGTVYTNSTYIDYYSTVFVGVTAVDNGGSAITTTLGTFNYSHEDGDGYYNQNFYWTGANGTLMTDWVAPDEITVGSKNQVFIQSWSPEYLNITLPTISVASGDVVQFRGNNATYSPTGMKYDITNFSGTTASFNV